MATTRAQERLQEDERVEEQEEEEDDHVEFGHPSPNDSYEDVEDDAAEPPQLASRYVGVEDRDAMDVDETVVDRAGPSAAEVKSLGPIEELEAELFDKIQREVPLGSGTMKDIFVCKFCTEEFTYMVRDTHDHKNVCPKYPGRESLTHDVRSVPDEENPELMVDVEVAGEPADAKADGEEDEEEEVNGPDAPVFVDDARTKKDEDEEHADVGDADMGLEPGEEEEDEDETQMLDDEPPTVIVPDRIEMPDDKDESRPILKVAKAKALETSEALRDEDMVEEARSESETEETTKSDARGRGDHKGDGGEEHDSPENASETASTGSAYGGGRDAFRTSFRQLSETQSQCLQCGRVCSGRGSALASHYKKCPAQPQLPSNRAGTSVQLITPKKKTTKRRITGQEFELLEEETTSQGNDSETDSQRGALSLRRSKRFKADSKDGDKVVKPTASEMEPLDVTASTAATVSTTAMTGPSATPMHAKPTDATELDDYPLSEFDLVAHEKRLKCQHCHTEIVFREDLAEKHLLECDIYKASRVPTTPVATQSKHQKRGKTTDRDASGLFGAMSTSLRHPERLRASDVLKLDHESALTWIFGSYPVERMRSYYGKSPMVARSPATRLNAVNAEMCELDVVKLLANVPQSTQVTAMVPTPNGGREYTMVPCTSPTVAWNLYLQNAPLVWRAPEIVVQMFAPHFAKELGCGPMIATNQHDAEVLCARGRLRLDWQYHKTDSFVVCLRGKALWKMRASGIESPLACFHLSTTDPAHRESMAAMQVLSLGVGSGQTTVPVPTGTTFDFGNDSDGDEDMERTSPNAAARDPRSHDAPPLTGQQMVADAGAIVYIPAGTWYYVDGLEGDWVLLQFQMKTVAVGDIVSETLRQLVASQATMREPVRFPVDGDIVAPQQLVLARLRTLTTQLLALSANELLPEFMTNSVPTAVECDAGSNCLTQVFTYDIRDPSGFQGGRNVHFFKRSTFRVTPLAALIRADELPPLVKSVEGMAIPSVPPPTAPSLTTPAPTKKALNRKNKRVSVAAAPVAAAHGGSHTPSLSLVTSASNGAAPTPTADSMYILYLGVGGNGGGRVRVKVQFWCNAAQQAMVDWIRSRDTTDSFRVSELAKVLAHYQGGRADFELLKTTARFLCMAGYLTNVDVPI